MSASGGFALPLGFCFRELDDIRLETLRSHLDLDSGMSLQVEVPGRVSSGTSGVGENEQLVTFCSDSQRDFPLLSRSSPDRAPIVCRTSIG